MTENVATPNQETAGNLGQLLEQRARAAPDKHFLFSEADGRHFTYADLSAPLTGPRYCCELTASQKATQLVC